MCTGNSVLGQVSVLDLTVSGRQAAQSRAVPCAAWPTRGRARWLEVPSNRPTKSITRSTKSISIHHSQSSQSISIYDREIGAKISVSVSISRFLRLDNVL